MWNYDGRPGLSPVTAGLLASGAIAPGMLALDVGAGDGAESVGLAEQGVCVVALDADPDPRAPRLARRCGVEPGILFVKGDALALSDLFEPDTFDLALDVLVYNNVCSAREPEGWQSAANAYASEVARVLKPGGKWILQWRAQAARAAQNQAFLVEDLPSRASEHFDIAGPIWSHIPEFRPRRRTGFAPIGVAILTKTR